jgi:hypothetical protein
MGDDLDNEARNKRSKTVMMFSTLISLAQAMGCVIAIGQDMSRASASAGKDLYWTGAVDSTDDLAKLCSLMETILAQRRAKLEKGEV